jgi:alanine dehydrogenase
MTTTAHAPLWISEADVEALVDPVALIAALRAGFLAADCGAMLEPPSATMRGLDGGSAYLSVFPAHDRASGLASVKVLSGRPANAADGRPEIDAVVVAADARTGAIAALICARALTAWRTAAVTALALERLAGGPGEARGMTIGLVGTGLQALTHGRVLAAAGLAERLIVASPRRGRAAAEAFAARMTAMTGVPAEAADVGGIAAACDALATMTLATTPLALGRIPDDMILACIGPFLPGEHELDPALLARAALVVSDHPERLRRQWAGSPLAAMETAPLLSMAAALRQPPAAARGLRIFLSDGRGFEDNVAAALVLDGARRTGRGLALP